MRSWVTGWEYDMINGAITYFPVLGKRESVKNDA